MSMFPHSLTLIKRTSEGYSSQIVKDVYWSGAHTRNISNNQADLGNTIQIVAPLSKDSLFDVGDIVIKGEHALTITSVEDLEDHPYSTIISKSVYDVGSTIDNVVLQCQ